VNNEKYYHLNIRYNNPPPMSTERK